MRDTSVMKSILVFSMFLAFPSATIADLADVVRCQEIAFSQSLEAQDLSKFKSFIDNDARFVSNAVSKGPDAIAAAWGVFFTNQGPKIKWRPQFVEVLEDGKLASRRLMEGRF